MPSLPGDRTRRTYVRTDAAPGAEVGDRRVLPGERDRRAAERPADAAARAPLQVDRVGFSPDPGPACGDDAGLFCDDDPDACALLCPAEGIEKVGQVVGIDRLDPGDPARPAEGLKRYRHALDARGRHSRVGVWLVTGHRGDPVVQDDDDHLGTVVDGV